MGYGLWDLGPPLRNPRAWVGHPEEASFPEMSLLLACKCYCFSCVPAPIQGQGL